MPFVIRYSSFYGAQAASLLVQAACLDELQTNLLTIRSLGQVRDAPVSASSTESIVCTPSQELLRDAIA